MRKIQNKKISDIEPIDKLDPKYFFFDLSLYEKVDLNEDNIEKADNIINYSEKFDAYNFAIKDNTTFEGVNNYSNTLGKNSSYFSIYIKCSRSKIVFKYFVLASETKIQKVGQYPSLADLNIEQIKEYKNVLSKEKLKEFIRGIGLRAHGVGIGSFVYLRRVFEFLIEQEHKNKKAEKVSTWDEVSYKKGRMVEKIDLLKGCLPSFLVENKDLYSMLSLGVHELSEEQCLKYFDALKMGIMEILDEKVIEEQREKRRMLTADSLQRIRQEMSKS